MPIEEGTTCCATRSFCRRLAPSGGGPFGDVDVHTILYAAVQRSADSAHVWRHCKPKSLVPDFPDADTRKAWETKAQDAISRRMQDVERSLDGNFRRRDTDSF